MNAFGQAHAIFLRVTPEIRARIVVILTVLAIFNIGIWGVAIMMSVRFPLLIGLVTLAYGFGLRHAVDADHIAAIDNTTRKLMRDGKRPVAVGLFFSLGHSSVVILLSGLVAFSAPFVTRHIESFKATGSVIGTLVSCLFLLVLSVISFSMIPETYRLFRSLKNRTKLLTINELDAHLDTHGIIARLLRPLMRIVTQSWHLIVIGFLFGLGFDTASEIGLLSMSAVSGSSGMSPWVVMLLPLAFTAGMTLVDSLNSIVMLGAYGWSYVKPARKLYYTMTITVISALVALCIGGIEGLQLIGKSFTMSGKFFALVSSIDLASTGYLIILMFMVCSVVSIGLYKIKRYDLLDEQ